MDMTLELPDAEATRGLGQALAAFLRPGDLVILTGELGAGKTVLTQGIGAGLNVRGQVSSPTFIVAREHPPLGNGPALVHVDAYRVGSLEELDALDLDASVGESVTVVEWGEGLVEGLAQDRLEITLQRPHGAGSGGVSPEADVADDSGTRHAVIHTVGARWDEAGLGSLADFGKSFTA